MPHPFLKFFTACITRRNQSKQVDGVREERSKERIREDLPEELVIESILTRLPARTLAVCCCVSKLWYNSILNDSRFAVIHNNQNKSKQYLVLDILNVSRSGDIDRAYFFSLLGREKVDTRYLFDLSLDNIYEIIGFCNGLTCINAIGVPADDYGTITVVNLNRGETLVLPYSRPTSTGEYIYLCHGFGFDSLSQVYKAVLIFASAANDGFLYMVITLGTISWRKILISTSDMLPPPGSPPFPGQMVTRVSRTLCKQATLCGNDLFWRTNNDGIQMLLSFDLHEEKIRFIRLPNECTLTVAPTQYLADDHLISFKGYPCIARSERITTASNSNHSGHRCNYQTGVCCCCYKVHMYTLKDKGKQVWSREKTFDVQIKDQELPTPICCHFDTSAAAPPTRILTFSDEVLLYWFNGERLVFYNLQEKRLKVVECPRMYPGVFQTKMNERLERLIGDDSNIDCPSMDYQLHAQVENIVSLKTFIPKEAKTIESNCPDDLMYLLEEKIAAGWVTTGRETLTYYVFC